MVITTKIRDYIISFRENLGLLLFAATLFLAGIVFPNYGICSTGLDPSRIAKYNVADISSRRIERGLGSPDRIQREAADDKYIYWYDWTAWDASGKIADRGQAGFLFDHNNRLTGFSIFLRDKNGKFVETTLQDAISLSTK